ncbi:ester cyclase [Amycolatopsis magusensis]|uniref:nuclear transport factor 2 family protein n=1 Tax=Amycolatopsis magusensis TaxID=882444 RepID=UPI003C2EE95A
MELEKAAHAPYDGPEEFITEWTDRIWVGRGIGLIRENYAADAVVHGAYGTTRGAEQVVRSTLMKINAFPDRVGQAADVVWEPRGSQAFLSSHLVLSAGRHTGPTAYAEPTFREFNSYTIATCLYRLGVMEHEWVVRDEAAVVRQLGLDPAEVARRVAFGAWDDEALQPLPRPVLEAGDTGPRPDRHRGECEWVLELVEQVWNQRMLHQVEQYVARDVTSYLPRHRSFVRPDGYQRGLLELLAPMPDARFEVREVVAHEDPARGGVRVALVWWLRGTYCGTPVHGPLTGSPVTVLGSSQFHFRDGRIVAERRVYDEIAVLAQLARARGDEPA